MKLHEQKTELTRNLHGCQIKGSQDTQRVVLRGFIWNRKYSVFMVIYQLHGDADGIYHLPYHHEFHNFAHPWAQGKLVSHFKLPFVTHFMILALSLCTKRCPVDIFASVLVLAFQEKMYCGGGGEDGWNGREAF